MCDWLPWDLWTRCSLCLTVQKTLVNCWGQGARQSWKDWREPRNDCGASPCGPQEQPAVTIRLPSSELKGIPAQLLPVPPWVPSAGAQAAQAQLPCSLLSSVRQARGMGLLTQCTSPWCFSKRALETCSPDSYNKASLPAALGYHPHGLQGATFCPLLKFTVTGYFVAETLVRGTPWQQLRPPPWKRLCKM